MVRLLRVLSDLPNCFPGDSSVSLRTSWCLLAICSADIGAVNFCKRCKYLSDLGLGQSPGDPGLEWRKLEQIAQHLQ